MVHGPNHLRLTGNKLLFEPISESMEGTSGLAGPTEQSMASLEMSKISELKKRMDTAEFLQIKRTAAAKAKIVNKVKLPSIAFTPKITLPGTLQQFTVKIDKNSNFKFNSFIAKNVPDVKMECFSIMSYQTPVININ